MVIETRSPEETFAVGKSLGEKAFPGQVLTLTGDLGVGKTVFTQGLAEGLGIEEPSFRFMKKGVCPSIILMSTESVTLKRWTRWDLKNT